MNDWIAPAAAVGIVALVGVGMAWTASDARRRARARAAMAEQFGFVGLSEPYDDMQARLARHHRCRPDQVRLRAVHRKDAAGHILYLLDYDASTSGSPTHHEVAAAVLPGASLPRFSVFPRVPAGELGASVADRLIERSLQATGARLADMSAYPAFSAKYVMALLEAETSPTKLPAVFYERMVELDWASVDGGGDLLVVSLLNLRQTARPMERDLLGRTIQAAGRLADALGR